VHLAAGHAGGASGSSPGGGTAGSSAGSAGTPIPQCIPDHPAGTTADVCGDGNRSATEACDDGNTLPDDGCSPACKITPQLVSPHVVAVRETVRINAGGGAVGSFSEDRFSNAGGTYATTHAIDTSGVANAAPPEVYQSDRGAGEFAYTLSGLKPGVAHTLRLHFAELWFDSSSVGARVFNVVINGTTVLENFDIVAVAGANKAVVREFRPVANAEGQIIVNFVTVVGGAKVNGLELVMPPAASGEAVAQINCGGTHLGTFVADQYTSEGVWGSVSGGAFAPTENVVTTSGVENAAPAGVYQSQRWGNTFSYTLIGLTPTLTYTVRLHFAETYYALAGIRIFNVSINGTRVIENFDVYGVAGFNHAVVRDFQAIVPANGQIVVSFDSVSDNAILNGLELFAPTQAMLPLRTIGTGRHPLAAGCNALAVAFSEQTDNSALYLSRFKSAGQPLGSVQVAQTGVSAPEPVVAALPGDDFVVAWTDFDDDELGISLRKVVGGVAQGKAIVANEDPAFSQSQSDIVFDGNELVVAWADAHDPANGPDLHYRLFTPDLEPLTGDQVLAATGAVEDNVVLAGHNGHWAAAWRSGSQGEETIEVQSGALHWTVGPFLPGAADDRPDLIFLDGSHLAVAFTMGTDPDNTGIANVPRLHAAVLDPSTPGATASFELAPAQMPYATEFSRGQTQPSLVMASDHVLVAWRSEAMSGEHLGSELWSRRVPFTVNGSTITLDPSHLEVPLIQTDAQRESDQNAFRMVPTTLWPSGGIASVWDDAGRTFGAKAGGTDVVLQVGPDPKEPQAAPLHSYAVSDDGLYYKVNLLRRNYPGPTISKTYQGDATYLAGQFVPEFVFDGDDSQYIYRSASGTDPNAGSTLTIDMGQYFSVGGVRIRYYYTNNAPATQSLRLGRTPSDTGDWDTILNNTPGLDDQTYSFNAINARFLELKMKGTWAAVMEVEVFPSAQTGPAPSPLDGYDLSYFATATANSSCREPAPWMWPGGAIFANILYQGLPPYATSDCVGTYDLGAQYPISRLYTNFYVGSNWAGGGRIDVAAVPGAYSNVYDSGVGNQFAYTDTMGHTFPSQPVQYIRMTDYALPGGGPSAGILQSVQAFVTPPPRTAYFPLSDDSRYFKVNVLRRPNGVVQPTASVVYGGGASAHPNASTQAPANVIDGDDLPYWWVGSTNPSSATSTLMVDLGQVVSLGGIRQVYHLPPTASYGLRVAETSTNWATIVDLNANTPPDYDQTVSFASKQVRYIELTMKGAGGSGVMLKELMAYPSSTALPAPSSTSHFDLSHLNGITVKPNENMYYFGDGNSRLGGAWRGKTIADGATGDATMTIDLGQQYQSSQLNITFYGASYWPNGGKVEVDDGSGTWFTVRDTGVGTALAPSGGDGVVPITFTTRPARFVRLTQYLGTVAETTIENIEIF